MYGFTLDQLRDMPLWLLGVYARGVTTDERAEPITDDALMRLQAGQPI